jgi:hypothetical protein
MSFIAGAWADTVPAFAACGFDCPQYKNPTDYFMAIACDAEGTEAMFADHDQRWLSTKRALFTAAEPVAVDADGPVSVTVEQTSTAEAHQLSIIASPEERNISDCYQLRLVGPVT